MKKLVLLSLIAVASTGFAADCGCFELGAEALYWKPAAAPFIFGQLEPPQQLDERFLKSVAVYPDYQWGFRLYGDYLNPDCCYFFQIGWIYFRSNTSTSVRPEGDQSLATLFGSAVSAKARIKTDYDMVNLRGGYTFQLGHCFGLGLFAGARYVNLERKVGARGPTPTGRGFASAESQSSFEGGGLEFGLFGDLSLPCSFSLAARLGGLAVIGRSRAIRSFQSATSVTRLTVQEGAPGTICRPGVEVRLELAYTYCCDCFGIRGYIGYELDYYFSVLNTVFVNEASNQFNMGFGGPLVGLSVQF